MKSNKDQSKTWFVKATLQLVHDAEQIRSVTQNAIVANARIKNQTLRLKRD